MVMCIVYLAVAPAHGQVPNTNRLIIGCAHEVFTIGMEVQVSDPIIVSRQREHAPTRPRLEDADLLVARASCNVLFELARLELLLSRVD